MLIVLPVLLVAAAGCGSSGDSVVSDPALTTAPSSSPSSSPSPATPTVSPSVGTYPAFPASDYSYTLVVSCFCADTGTPIRVTVVDGEVSAASYAADAVGRGAVKAGDPADPAFALTIDDVIEHANDTSAASVQVDWPAGQDHPDSVYVDQDRRAADEEVGYTISDVQVG